MVTSSSCQIRILQLCKNYFLFNVRVVNAKVLILCLGINSKEVFGPHKLRRSHNDDLLHLLVGHGAAGSHIDHVA